MRPKLLEIEGLQSFCGIQRIDFESLGETGLFGIFGPTGSGKSTILDAITFALYGKVKRAERGTQGIINTKCSIVKVAFTFELLKNGDRKIYRVERVYQRKKDSENSCEPRIARLIGVTEVGETPLCDKASEVSSNIEELLGLSHDDFTRAVVLPQNSFHEFLMLDNAKKRDMLERIFYLEEYGKLLWEKMNRKMMRMKSSIDVLAGELKGYADASDNALNEAEEALKSAVSERTKIEAEAKLIENSYNEAREVWQHVVELSAVNQKQERHIAIEDNINKKRVTLDKAVKADGLLDIIRSNRELSLKLSETAGQLDEVLRALPAAAAGLAATRSKHEEIKSEASVEQPRLTGLKIKLEGALDIQAEIQAICSKIQVLGSLTEKLEIEILKQNDLLNTGKRELGVLEQSAGTIIQEMKFLKTDPEYRHAIQQGTILENETAALNGNKKEIEKKAYLLKNTISALEQKLAQVKAGIISSNQELANIDKEKQLHEASAPEDRNSILKYKEKIHAIQTVYDILKLRKAELRALENRVSTLRDSLKLLEKDLVLLKEKRENAFNLYSLSKLELEEAIGEMGRNAAYTLSRELKDGDPCPVCGSEIHPAPASQLLEKDMGLLEHMVESARKKLADAEKLNNEAEKSVLIANEQAKSLKMQIDGTLLEIEAKTAEYDAEMTKLPEELRKTELEQLLPEIEKMNAFSTQKMNDIDAWEKKSELYKSEILKINNMLVQDGLKENGVASELKVNRENKDQLDKSFEDINKSLNEKQSEYSEFLRKFNISGAAAELKRLTANDLKTGLLQKQLEQVQSSIDKKRDVLEKIKEQLTGLNNEIVKVKTDKSSLSLQKSEKEAKLKELAGDFDIQSEIRQIDEKLNSYVKLEKQFRERLQSLEKRHNELLTRKSTLENQSGIYSENLRRERSRLDTALLDRGFSGIEEVEKSIMPKDMQKTFLAEINEFDQTGTNIKIQKELILKKLNSRYISEEEWNRISAAWKEAAAYREECVSRSEVARNTFSTLKSKHAKWVELNRRYSELAGKFSLYDQIQRLLRAERGKDNSFIDFIAEERLRYIAAKASEILGVMTKFKYALELDTNSGFVIRDNANGGVHRMVSSLSGGETFLTALSLALALSEQIQLKGQSPLEFFFLDEGFGTLDNNLLDSVIDSLERLSRKERVIGLISHVPELRLRIARRLIVEPPSSHNEGSTVRIEKA